MNLFISSFLNSEIANNKDSEIFTIQTDYQLKYTKKSLYSQKFINKI